MHKYVKIGKINGKKKKKRVFSASWAGGDFGPVEHRCARGADGPAGPPAGDRAGTTPWERAHVPARRGGDDVRGGRGGRTGRSSTASEASRRFFVAVPVPMRTSLLYIQ
jgi:hypothetical protein